MTGCDKIEFFTILMNVTGPIDRLELKNGFTIESMNRDEFASLLKSQEPAVFSGWRMTQIDFSRYRNDEFNFFIIKKIFDAQDEGEGRRLCLREGTKIFAEKHESYLDNVINLLNLFGEGSIFAPERCYQFYTGDQKSCFYHEQKHQSPLPMPIRFDLEKLGLNDAQSFIDKTIYPFKHPYIQLAFDNFIESYFTRNFNLSFLSLMMALEALLSRGNQELTYTIRRNTAVLIGETSDECESAFSDINKYYTKRSKIVHGDESIANSEKVVTPEEVINLRQYVRKSIKKANELNIEKTKLLDTLNRRGFPS